jgi:hypothetical protein
VKPLLIPLLAVAGALLGCATPPPAIETPLRDGAATVKLGGHARFGHVTLTPVRIEEDSRCPLGVQCVWAGRVRVAVYFEDGGEVLVHPIILTLGEPFPIEGGGGVAITAVCPYPHHPNPIAKDDYRITIALGVTAPPSTSDTECPA